MNSKKPKIVIIAGPTASGKSDAAIKIAKKFNGEIISADSRQIYRGMNIGTGKVSKDLNQESIDFQDDDVFFSDGIIHHGIDIADPNENFNVTDFKQYAEQKIEEILSRKKLPIICGGTGFWINAVVDNVSFPAVKPDIELRKKLSTKDAGHLFNFLREMDPERAKTIDKNNKIRLIRALEICKHIGKVPRLTKKNTSSYNFLQIGIDVPKSKLNENIKKRLNMRFEQEMIDEVKHLHANDISWERLESFGLEYRRIAQFLQGKLSEEEMKERLYFDIIHYAKRQMTWLKKDARIQWKNSPQEIEIAVENFLKK